jgi:hypothetical protein
MATQRANVEYTDQPYFSKAAQRPQPMPTANTNAAPGNSNVVADPWGKTQTTYKMSSGPVRSAKSTDEIFSDQYAQSGLQPANNNRAPDQTSKAQASYATPSNIPKISRTYKSRIPVIKRKKKVSIEKMALARVRVTTANAWIGGWAMFWYLTFQMPLAVISATGLGMAYAVYMSIVSGPLGFALPMVEGVIEYIAGPGSLLEAVTKWALSLFGINFDPMLLFITPFALVFLLGLFQLILTWFVYSAMRIKSLSGKAGGLKGLMFILAGVGYAIPILNMFPLIFLWMLVVWIYPK